MCFSPDGGRLATAGEDKTARVWDAGSGGDWPSLEGHTGPVYSVPFSPDGTRIAAASDVRMVRVWSARESAEDREKRRRFWREQQAKGAEKAGQWFAAAFHLSRLIDADPANPSLYARRCHAFARQGQWGKAAADLLRGADLCPPAGD